jgi:MFS family permease
MAAFSYTSAHSLSSVDLQSTWTINAYVICLASFMLAAGKVSDLWSAKYVFIGGL